MRSTLIAIVSGATIGGAILLLLSVSLTRADSSAVAPPSSVHRVPTIWGDRFPDISLQTHEGRTVRLYRDLIKGKTVALNFFYVGCTSF